jgi:hypothetical protein
MDRRPVGRDATREPDAAVKSAAMPLLSASVDTFILASAIFAVFLHRKLGATNTGHPRLHNAISAFLVLHTLYIIYVLCFFRPPNLFLSLHIPTQTSSERIRAIILKQSKDDRLPDHLEELLTRLTSFDFRTFYIRFAIFLACSSLNWHVVQVWPECYTKL